MYFSTKFLSSVLVLAWTGCVKATSRLPASSSYRSIAVWGANLVSGINLDPAASETSLAATCSLPHVDIVHIYAVATLKGPGGLPGMTLSTHCNTPYPGYSVDSTGYVILQCPQIGQDIKTCQSLGKKVLLSIVSQTNPMVNDAEGTTAADNIWYAFLGGSRAQTPRPFGDAVLDGVDIWIRDGVNGYSAMVRQLKTYFDAAASSRVYLLAGTPRCSFPDANFGPTWANRPLTDEPTAFDYLSIFAMSSPDCSYLNTNLFYQSFNNWVTWANSNGAIPLFLAIPSDVGLSSTSPGDYIEISELLHNDVMDRLRINSGASFKGVMMWDTSAEQQNQPCVNDTRTYGRYVRDILNTPGNITGTLTCTPRPRTSNNTGASTTPGCRACTTTSHGIRSISPNQNIYLTTVLSILVFFLIQ